MATEQTEQSDYPAMLSKLQPSQAVDILNDRVRQVSRLNAAVADWLQEKRRLEDQYASGLRRLARQHIDDMDLGIFSVPWSTLTNSMDAMADSHSALASKIEVDVERPLRDFASTDRKMQAMSTVQGNLASVARDVEKAQQKTDKLQGRGDRPETNKMTNANTELDQARSQWDSQASHVYRELQELDETRLNHLRDVLTQFQTLELDQLEKGRVAAEQCLNVLLNVETADEIKTFAIRAVANKPAVNRTQRESYMPAPTPPRTASSSNVQTPAQNIPVEDRVIPVSESKKGGFKGLKRLGTVMGRRNRDSKVIATPPTSMAESPDPSGRKAKTNTFGRLGKPRDPYNLEPPQEEQLYQRPSSPLRLGSEILEPPSSGLGFEAESPSQLPRAETAPQLNGTLAALENGSQEGTFAGLDQPRQLQPEASDNLTALDSRKDSQGFSIPPSNLDPISQAQADAAFGGENGPPQFKMNIRNVPIQEEGADTALNSVASKLQAPPPTQRRIGTVRGRRDARNSALVTNFTPPPEEPSQGTAFVAAPSMEQPEPERTLPSTELPPLQSSPSIPDTSLVQASPEALNQNTLPVAPPTPPIVMPEPQPVPIRPFSRSTGVAEPSTDNQSIRSGRSLATTGSQGMRHPELHHAGLTASIVETVSTRIENGLISNSSLIGEIALAYNATDLGTPLGHEKIRLEKFSSLDKVAPNPGFIQHTSDSEGEYSVNLANITKTQVAFKYQLRAEDANAQAPLLITPAVKIEPTQISVIVGYSLNPDFDMRGSQSITLSNVMLGLTLEGAKAISCLSRPVGTFSREKNLIFWQLNDITLVSEAQAGKLLARFATDVEAKGASAEMRWEISGDNIKEFGSGLSVSMVSHSEGADPFADEEGTSGLAAAWKPVPAVKKLASGNYIARP